MKYVIDIPDNEYKNNRHYYDSVYKGVPLDSVVEEYVERGAITENMKMLDMIDSIKAEISERYLEVHPYNLDVAQGLDMAFDIIEKHISGKEKE